MAVKLRLMRLGRRGQPFYRIVAVDSRKRRDGAYIEKIGHYNPKSQPAELAIDDDKALNWLKKGAVPSDTVRSLLSRRGILLAWDLSKRGAATEEITERVTQFRLEKEAKLQHEAKVAKEKAKPKAAAVEAVSEPAVEAATIEPPATGSESAEAPPATEGEASPGQAEEAVP